MKKRWVWHSWVWLHKHVTTATTRSMWSTGDIFSTHRRSPDLLVMHHWSVGYRVGGVRGRIVGTHQLLRRHWGLVGGGGVDGG